MSSLRARRLKKHSWLTRITAAGCLAAAGGTVSAIVATAGGDNGAVSAQIDDAVRPAWDASRTLAAELDKLAPGSPRGAAQRAAAQAAQDDQTALTALRTLSARTQTIPPELTALLADASWVDAVQAALRDPGNAQRHHLARTAAGAARLAGRPGPMPKTAIGGTGHLLSALTAKRPAAR